MANRWTRGFSGLLLFSCAAAAPGGRESDAREAEGGELRDLIGQCMADQGALGRFYDLDGSPARIERMRTFARDWLAALDGVDFDALDPDGRIDWLLLKHELDGNLVRLDRDEGRAGEIAPLVPFAQRIVDLAEARQRVEAIDPEQAARELDELKRVLDDSKKSVEEHPPELEKSVANRAAGRVDELASALERWYEFRAGYDPLFTWWTSQPYDALHDSLADYASQLREKLAGLKEDDQETILGDPIGREALLEELAQALIPYTPEELIQIAERELAWCETEMRNASQAMGCGDDWKAALERVKQDYVPPGEQPALIQALAREAWDYVEANELVTVPPLAKEIWRMDMLSPEAQRTSPFFLGGESILVSFPTDAMTHEEKAMSLRGNNRHFCRATVHHEVIPGHHLQGFMTERFMSYRWPFSTPFWTEGWALYWEMRLWERGFVASPEDKVGALFWRMHRCARIQFSLGFHLGQKTPQECIDLLVERVGHERENAEAEVRRSFNGDYGPLYQIAYMIGALQFRALHQELVVSGRMTERAFHDAVLQNGNMPVELVRAKLANLPLTRDFSASWRFYDLE